MTGRVEYLITMTHVRNEFIVFLNRVKNELSSDVLKLYLAPLLQSQSAYLVRA